MKWFYKAMGEEIGPLSSSELRQHATERKLTPSTYLRREDQAQWCLAENVKGLFNAQDHVPSTASVDESMEQSDIGSFVAAEIEHAKLVEIANKMKQGKPTAEHVQQANNRKEYKVLTQKDRWFSGKFDPYKLEEALNSYAEQGWVVIAATTASFPGFMSGNREEMVIIMER